MLILRSQCYFFPVILHDRLVDVQLHHFNCLHVVLDIVADANQLLYLLVHRLPQHADVGFDSSAVVEDGVVAHKLLHLEDVFDLLEVASDLLRD